MKNNDNYRYISLLSSKLFAAEDRRHTRMIDMLFRSNREIVPRHGDGFTYEGAVYKPSTAPTSGRLTFTSLHYSLSSEIRAYLADKRLIEHDKRMMEQTLFKLLYPCTTNQDCRDALPECLIKVIPEIERLQRTRAEAFTIQNDERALRQYEKIYSKMEFYSAVHLIY